MFWLVAVLLGGRGCAPACGDSGRACPRGARGLGSKCP